MLVKKYWCMGDNTVVASVITPSKAHELQIDVKAKNRTNREHDSACLTKHRPNT